MRCLAGLTLDVGVNSESDPLADVALKPGTVLAEVVPQAGEMTPGRRMERFREM